MSRLTHYLDRLIDTIFSRREIEIEEFFVLDRSTASGQTSEFYARLRFWDGSLLQVEEALVTRRLGIFKIRYSYHYQRADGGLVFRYDNAPHHPELPGFPYHVHIEDWVEPADPPDLHDVLRKIDSYLYGSA